jgi:EAL domain-containing protein (putative c-di-GMP-specific phosphodiesterase class I)
MRPVVQFQARDVSQLPDLAMERFQELDRLGIKICLVQFEERPETLRMVQRMPVSLVTLSAETVKNRDQGSLSVLVERLHGFRTEVIATGIDNPHTVAHVWGCGVDFIQGNFLQFPSEDLSFDFRETAL